MNQLIDTEQQQQQQQYIRVYPRPTVAVSSSRPRLHRYHTRDWPSHRPPYLQFVLYKENKDTNECVALLSKLTGIKPSHWFFAGTKDKRAVTAQLCTVYKYPAELLRVVNERLYGIKVGNYRYVDKPLELGDLLGNRFNIVLRSVNTSKILYI
jgi:tRNA pseudouridine13 synthase